MDNILPSHFLQHFALSIFLYYFLSLFQLYISPSHLTHELEDLDLGVVVAGDRLVHRPHRVRERLAQRLGPLRREHSERQLDRATHPLLVLVARVVLELVEDREAHVPRERALEHEDAQRDVRVLAPHAPARIIQRMLSL